MANFIRGDGLIASLDDIKNIVIKNVNGVPVLVKDVAENVAYGKQVRYGAFTQDGKEAVGGMVLMLRGSNPSKVITNVQERMKEIQKSLPEGIEIRPFLDRSELIARTTDTVKQNLLEGALIVIFALVILLGSFRGGLITATTIPLSLLFAFILMKQFNVWANLMSLGAIDFGIIVDGAVIIIEGTVFQIQQKLKKNKMLIGQKTMDELTYTAGSQMMNSAFFGQLIILIVFTPILFLTGVEGKMFKPMAYTFGFAMIGAIVLCLTYVPMMASLFMKSSRNENSRWAKMEMALERFSDRIFGRIQKVYEPILIWVLKRKTAVVGVSLLLMLMSGVLFSRMGGEFIPQLDEGDIAMQALVRPGSALSESVDVSQKIEKILLENFPEVKTVVARIGVADIPTDPMPMDIADMYIILNKNRDTWTSATSKEELIEKMKEKLSVLVGVNLIFSQPVELRFNELVTGVREDIAVKLYGEDLQVLSEKAEKMEALIKTIPGVGDASAERISGLPQITVQYDRKKIAQYGLSIEKVNNYISTAFAGGVAGKVFEGEKRFDLVVRLAEKQKQGIKDIENLYIDLPNGTQIHLDEVANISYLPGPMQISRENTFRRTYVGVNVRGRDVESVVKDIQEKLENELDLSPGYYVTYGGEFENLQSAKNRLLIVVPIALTLIFILLYFALQSFSQTLMIYAAIPLAAIGGVWALWLRGMPFSISAGVGFIVLFGVAVLNGLVLINRFNDLKAEGEDNILNIIKRGTKERIRPIFLTATTDIFGFLPMTFSVSAGAEVQRPLATVVIGGMISATILTLFVLPGLYMLMEEKSLKNMWKRNKLIKPALFVVLLAVVSVGNAQELQSLPTISMEKAQTMAIENYPQLKAAELQVKSEQVMKKSAFDFGDTQVFTGKEEVGNNSDGVFNKVGIQQSNIDLLGIPSKMKLQKEKVQLAEAQLELNKAQIEREASLAWADVLVKKQILRVYKGLDSVFSNIQNAAKLRYEVEATSKLEFLATSNQSNQVQLELKKAYRDYVISLKRLNMWLVSDTLYTVPDDVPESLSIPLPNMQISLDAHPVMEASTKEVAVASAQKGVQTSVFLPKLQGQYTWQEIQGNSGFYQFQVGLQVPLLSGAVYGKRQQAAIQEDIARQKLLQNKLELTTQYQSVLQEYLKWQETWFYYKDTALPLAKEQQKGSIVSYREGAADYVSFLQNIRDAIKIEVDSWNVFGNYLSSKSQLEYYLKDSE